MTKHILAFSILVAAALLVAGCSGTQFDQNTINFKLTDLDAKPIALSDDRFQNKVVLVDIWGTWCQPCHIQTPYLIEFQERYREQGLEIIGVEFDMYTLGTEKERRDAMKEYVKKTGINYTVILGGEVNDVASVFEDMQNFQGFPTTFLIGRDGLVRHVSWGFIESDAIKLEENIRALLTENNSTP